MNLTHEQIQLVNEIEQRWSLTGYKRVEEILLDYKVLANRLTSDQSTYLREHSQAIRDIMESVEKYNKFQ